MRTRVNGATTATSISSAHDGHHSWLRSGNTAATRAAAYRTTPICADRRRLSTRYSRAVRNSATGVIAASRAPPISPMTGGPAEPAQRQEDDRGDCCNADQGCDSPEDPAVEALGQCDELRARPYQVATRHRRRRDAMLAAGAEHGGRIRAHRCSQPANRGERPALPAAAGCVRWSCASCAGYGSVSWRATRPIHTRAVWASFRPPAPRRP